MSQKVYTSDCPRKTLCIFLMRRSHEFFISHQNFALQRILKLQGKWLFSGPQFEVSHRTLQWVNEILLIRDIPLCIASNFPRKYSANFLDITQGGMLNVLVRVFQLERVFLEFAATEILSCMSNIRFTELYLFRFHK